MTQWVKFLVFCITYAQIAIPTSEQTLAWYAQFLSYKFKSHASVVNYLSGVKTLHLLLEADIRGFSGFLFKLAIRGLRRTCAFVPRQALPINPIILSHIYHVLDLNKPEHATFWAICLTSFFLLLRKSNTVADTLNSGDTSKQLCREDLCWRQDSVLVTLRWSKTNQFGDRLIFSLPKIPGSILCPYTALKTMIGLVPGDTGLCFVRSDGRPFTYYQLHSLLRKALLINGYPAHLFSSHSFRTGGCTFSFLCGVPSDLVRLLGGWRSDCYFRYLQFPLEARQAATQLMANRIQIMNW